jgi:hypothetical protein
VLTAVLEPDEKIEVVPVVDGDGAGVSASLRF